MTASFEKVKNIKELASLASCIWHEYWTCILSPEQIDFMVENFQSEHAIKNQIENENYTYYFIVSDGEKAGYFGISDKKEYLFLSKLYIKKEYRNKGLGTEAFEKIKQLSQHKPIRLTVNKYNINTIKAYEKWGFKTVDAVVTDIGSGFVMDDFIMEMKP
ncbi:c_GCAxxG_C_C family protein [Clostridium sp. CAG:967]|nr:c_GCAxxG_C_C family protein [Clostridium sp. CAG:967]